MSTCQVAVIVIPKALTNDNKMLQNSIFYFARILLKQVTSWQYITFTMNIWEYKDGLKEKRRMPHVFDVRVCWQNIPVIV